LARGDGQASAHGLIVPIELRGLAGGKVRAHRLARQLEHSFTRLRGGKLHRQYAVLEFDREQLGSSVDDALRGGKVAALAAESVRAERYVHRQNERIARRHYDAGDDKGSFLRRLDDAKIVAKRQRRSVRDADRGAGGRSHFISGDALAQLADRRLRL